MNATLIAPVLMIVLSAVAAIAYCMKGDLGHTVYWLAGAVLNAAVTFQLPRLPWSF